MDPTGSGVAERLRTPRGTWLLTALVLVAAGVFLLVGGRHLWFFGDDWAFIVWRRELYAEHRYSEWLFSPHNEHWSTVPVLVHAALFKAFGLHSYVPYLATVIVCHLGTCVLLRVVLLRVGVDGLVSVGAVAIFAFFGSGAENLTWGFQVGFVGAVMLGFGQLLVADHRGPVGLRDAVGAFLGVVGVMTAGVAVTMVGVVATLLVIRRRWVALLPQVILPGIVYVAWYLGYGRSRIATQTSDLSLIPDFVATGVEHSIDSLLQLPHVAIVTAFVVVVLACKGAFGPSYSIAPALAAAAGIVILFGISAVGRAGYGVDWARSSRYTYVAGALLLPCLGLAARYVASRSRPLLVVAWVVLAWSFVGNAADYMQFVDGREGLVGSARATIEAAAELAASDPTVNPEIRPEPQYSPDVTIGALRELVASGELPRPD